MKRLLFFLLVLVIAILIGIQVKTNPGYLLISTHHLAVQTRLWVAILLLVVLFCLLYFVVRVFKYTRSIPSRWRRWRGQEKMLKATRLTYQGLIAIVKGEWRAAQKKLIQEVKHSPAPLVNYLAAATAAEYAEMQSQRDHYLQQAYQAQPQEKLTVGLVQAQLQYHAAQYELALATLKQLLEFAPKQQQVLRLLAKNYQALADWDNVIALLPVLQKRQLFTEKFIFDLAVTAYRHILLEPCNIERLIQLWGKAPQNIRQRVEITVLYVKALLQFNQDVAAAEIIEQTLKHVWSGELVLLYPQVHLKNEKKQLAHAEHWLKAHAKDPQLLIVLGQLAECNQLWDKAKDYYQQSLAIQPSVAVYAAYARLLEQLGELEESLVYYRRGLLQTTK